MADQTVTQVVFVLEIQIKGALGNSCFFHDVGDGGIGDALLRKELKGIVQKRFTLPALILAGLSLWRHVHTPFILQYGIHRKSFLTC